MSSDDEIYGLTNGYDMASLIATLKDGSTKLTSETTKDLACDGPAAWAAIEAADREDSGLNFGGRVSGSLNLGNLSGHLTVSGEVSGDLTVDGMIGGNLNMSGRVGGELVVSGEVSGDVDVSGEVAGDLAVDGIIGGNLNMSGIVGGDVDVYNELVGNLSVGGDMGVGGEREFSGEVVGHVDVSGKVGGNVSVDGKVGLSVRLRPSEKLSLSRMMASVEQEIYLGEHVDVSQCDFREFADFDKLRFLGSNPFQAKKGDRQQLCFEDHRGKVTAAERSVIYRQLRQTLEKQGNRPAAGDFYYHESENRRLAVAERSESKWRSVEWLVLSAYKVLSSYGTRAWRPLAGFGGVALLASAVFAVCGVRVSDSYSTYATYDPGEWSGKAFFSTLLFTVTSMVSFFKPPDGELSTFEGWLQVLLRFTGPVLLAQAVLAIRERVAR